MLRLLSTVMTRHFREKGSTITSFLSLLLHLPKASVYMFRTPSMHVHLTRYAVPLQDA